MTETISKSLGESLAGKGELYAALAYDTSDKFGGMQIKSICMNFSSYENEDGRVCFYDRDMYIAPWTTTALDIVATDDIWLFASDIYFVGTVHYAGGIHETANVEFDVLLTGPTVAANALHGEIDATVPWATSGNLVGVRGKVDITASGNTGDATGVWAGITITSASVQRFGLQVGMNVEAYSNTICLPNAVLYLQSLPSGSTTDFSNTPYLVFSETVSGSGTGSNILFEVGHSWAQTVPTLEEDMLFWQDTLRIAVNKVAGTRTKYYIPLSTTTGTFTTAYPIITTYGTIAIDISSTTTGIDITDASTAGININGTCASGIIIGDGTTTGISITGATNYAIDIQTTGHFRMGTDPDSTDIGIPVTSSYPWNMEVYTEPGGALTAGDSGMTCGIRSRYLVSVAQTSTISIYAVDARLRVKHAIAGGIHAGIQATIEASTAAADFTGSSSTINAAGSFTLDFDELGSLSNSVWLCGVSIDSAVHGDLNVSSAQFVGLRISVGSSKEPWQKGIDIEGCTTGIDVGVTTVAGINLTSGGVLGIDFNGTWTGNCIQCGDSSTALTTGTTGLSEVYVNMTYTKADGGVHKAILSEITYTPASGGYSCSIPIAGKAILNGEFKTTASYMWGMQGQMHFAQAANINQSGSVFAAGRFVLTDEATQDEAGTDGWICCLNVDSLLRHDITTNQPKSIIRMGNWGTGSAFCEFDAAMMVYGRHTDDLFYFYDCDDTDGFIDASAHGATAKGRIKVDVDGEQRYIYMYSD